MRFDFTAQYEDVERLACAQLIFYGPAKEDADERREWATEDINRSSDEKS